MKIPVWILVLVGGAIVIVSMWQIDKTRTLLIERNDALAARDSLVEFRRTDSTVVYGKLARLSDSLKGLETELKRKPQVVTVMKLVPTSIDTSTGIDTIPLRRDTLTLVDSLIGPPVDVKAVAVLTPVTDTTLSVAWHWQVRPHPIDLTIDVGCRTDDGPYRPDIVVQVPPWVAIDTIATTTRPEVCAPQRLPGIHLSIPKAGVATAVIAGIFYLLGKI